MQKVFSKKIIFSLGLTFCCFSSFAFADLDPVASAIFKKEKEISKEKKDSSALGELLKDVQTGAIGYVPQDDQRYEYPKDDKFFDVKPVDDYKFSLLLDSILTDSVLDVPDVGIKTVGTQWKDWSKDTFFVDADVDNLNLRFQYVDGKKRPQEKPESFYLKVSFVEERSIGEQLGISASVNPRQKFNIRDSVIIKHNMPKSDAERGGVSILTSNQKQQRIFVRGRDDTSMVVIIPKTQQRNVRAVVFCPRDYDPWKLRGGSKKLHHTDYELVAIEASARGKAEAGVSSGLGAGMAKAHILTSENLLPSMKFYDESILQFPSVILEYKPFGKKIIHPMNNNSINMGIVVQTVHHNSFNQKTISTGQVKMTTRDLEMEEEIPIKIGLNNEKRNLTNFRMDTGACYALIKERVFEQYFIKSLLPQEAMNSSKNKK